MTPKNSIELQNDINNKMKIVIENVATQLTNKLKDIIEQNVYSYNETWGGRTGQFLESWYNTAVTVMGNYVSSYIEQDYSIMQIGVSNPYSHIDREELASIIESGEGYQINENVGERPFWNEFNQYVDVTIDNLIKTEMTLVGLYTI